MSVHHAKRWQVSTGGQRGEIPLTDSQRAVILEYVRQCGFPEERVRFVDHTELNTAYGPTFDILHIGSDVMPGPRGGGTQSANSRVTWRGAIAHELIGHREAALAGQPQSGPALEEAQSSIRAARFAPELSRIERYILLRDAIARLHDEGISVRNVKEQLFI
ncbi:MAG: hypothetical protein ETSY2_50870 [Candidatus Entotheonella gemina]|uniref:Uncharacterized protein n=1 Tax=Candidatus Entotheonella gemina TaxID=1429439 RepID=W4L7U8_9BACT|nr:MAG: hypothetical protein ETSY2_50870 [Candidatus Entotheonella gemina]